MLFDCLSDGFAPTLHRLATQVVNVHPPINPYWPGLPLFLPRSLPDTDRDIAVLVPIHKVFVPPPDLLEHRTAYKEAETRELL